MEEARVRELMALADDYAHETWAMVMNPAHRDAARARLESALRQDSEPTPNNKRAAEMLAEVRESLKEMMPPYVATLIDDRARRAIRHVDALVAALRQEPQGGMSEEETGVMRFARFGAELFKRHRNDGYPGDVDGGELQELAEKFGLIEQREVTEPCGDGCTCAEIGDFPSVCYFTTAEAKKARAILAAAGGRK